MVLSTEYIIPLCTWGNNNNAIMCCARKLTHFSSTETKGWYLKRRKAKREREKWNVRPLVRPLTHVRLLPVVLYYCLWNIFWIFLEIPTNPPHSFPFYLCASIYMLLFHQTVGIIAWKGCKGKCVGVHNTKAPRKLMQTDFPMDQQRNFRRDIIPYLILITSRYETINF